jgi:GMP synthase-like glutamine amidotransferase
MPNFRPLNKSFPRSRDTMSSRKASIQVCTIWMRSSLPGHRRLRTMMSPGYIVSHCFFKVSAYAFNLVDPRGLIWTALFESSAPVKLFGGCFGHQIISQALLGGHGVRVEKSPRGWEIGVHQVELSEEFASHFPELLFQRTLSYQFLHADHVSTKDTQLPANWMNIGNSALCDVQGLFCPGRVLTLQGHPEFDRWINKLCTAALSSSIALSNEEMETNLALVDQKDSARLAGEVVLEFFSRS